MIPTFPIWAAVRLIVYAAPGGGHHILAVTGNSDSSSYLLIRLFWAGANSRLCVPRTSQACVLDNCHGSSLGDAKSQFPMRRDVLIVTPASRGNVKRKGKVSHE